MAENNSNNGHSPPPLKRLKLNYQAKSEPASQYNDRDDDEESRQAFQKLEEIQDRLDDINGQAADEMIKVEQKYNQIRKPLFAKRNEGILKIPKFWLKAMCNHSILSCLIGKDEKNCLSHLKMLEVEDFEDIKSGYKIMFHFTENPFFENDVLVKEFHLAESGELISNSTEIKWKCGNDLSKKKWVKRYVKNFFSWYVGLDNSDELDTTTNNYPFDDQVAEAITDELWIYPAKYFASPPKQDGGDSALEDVSTDEDSEVTVSVSTSNANANASPTEDEVEMEVVETQ